MATGACGIDCTVCRLHVQGLCSTCGAGTSEAGQDKLAAQRRLFGTGCPLLECAVERRVGYCLRDCDEFPCERLESGLQRGSCYPFSEGFLQMQKRRRGETGEPPKAAWPENAPYLWEQLGAADPVAVCERTRAHQVEDEHGHGHHHGHAHGACSAHGHGPLYQLQALRETWRVDVEGRSATKVQGDFGGEWDRQLPFLLLVYLTHASAAELSGEMAAPRELYAGMNAFQGHHALATHDFESTFGRDAEAFARAAERLGGERVEGGDAAFRLRPLAKVAVDYLLWLADEEFPARLTILLDRDAARHYPADACATLVNLLTRRLLLAAR